MAGIRFLAWLCLLLLFGYSQGKCPAGCVCDNRAKSVRCEPKDSSVQLTFHDIDSNVQTLEILPKKRGAKDAFGSSLPNIFGDFRKLDRLIIRSSGLRHIPPETARQLSALQQVDLVGNEITSFKDLSFDRLPKLQLLQLSNNHIKEISDDSLRGLKDLAILGLSNNELQSVSIGAFKNQPYLHHLELRGNRLRDLPPALFNSIERLNYLDLSNNELTAIPRGIQHLSAAVILLEENKITTVPGQLVRLWSDSSSLADVSFFGNPLVCDENLVDYIAWSKVNDGFKKTCDITAGFPRAKCPTCAAPKKFIGKTVDSLGEREIVVPPEFQNDQALPKKTTKRPTTKDDHGYVKFEIVDVVRAPKEFDPRRDEKRKPIVDVQDTTAAKLKQYMPGAGVRCAAQRCYYFSAKGVKEWRTAEYFCQTIGLDLLEIGDAAEQKILMQLLIEAVLEDPNRSSPSRGWWIGFRYDTKVKAFLSATTGKPLPYTNWADGQPNNFASGEECVELWDTGDWNDVRCVLPLDNMFICESPASVGKGLVTHGKNIKKASGPAKNTNGRKTVSGSSSISSDSVTFVIEDA